MGRKVNHPLHDDFVIWASSLDKEGKLLDGSGWGDSSLSRIDEPIAQDFYSKAPGRVRLPFRVYMIDRIVRRIEAEKDHRRSVQKVREYYHKRERKYFDADIQQVLDMALGAALFPDGWR